MKILFDNIVFELQTFGGISRVWYEMINYLLGKNDIRLRFIEGPLSDQNLYRKLLDIDRNVVKVDRQLPLVMRRYLPVKGEKTDVFHSSYYRVPAANAIPQVTTVHDLIYEKFVGGIRRLVHTQQKARSLRESQKIICISENTRRDLLEFYPFVAFENTVVIPNGVGTEFFPLDDICDPIHIGESSIEARHFLLFVGGRAGYKNFTLALDLLNTEQARDLGLTLVAVGPPASESERSDVRNRDLTNSVHFLTGVSSNELNRLYNYAYCLVYPSRYEGFGIPVLEAMRAGCPVVASNASSIPEVAGNAALLNSPDSPEEFASSLRQLGDPRDRDNIRELGLARASRFTWERSCRAIESVYRSVA